jgi:hypothetical protein
LLAITIIDVLTISHLHVRTNFFPTFVGAQKSLYSYDLQNPDFIGLQNEYVNSLTERVLQAQPYIDLLKNEVNVEALPSYALYGNYHISDVITNYDIDAAVSGKSLAVSGTSISSMPLKDFIPKQPIEKSDTIIVNTKKSYNTFGYSITVNQPALFFLRDAHHPYWRAELDGKPIDILPALGHYKAIIVPAGTSDVRFSFEPPGVALSIWGAYGIIFLLIIIVGFETIRTLKKVD